MLDIALLHNKKVKVFHDIVGCAMDVYNEYNYGLTEHPYQYGLKHLLRQLGYKVEKEYELPLYLFGEKLEERYRCDLVVVRPEGNIIIECKAVKYIDEGHRNQLKNYMLLTHCPFGILINFCKTKKQIFSETYEYIEELNRIESLSTSYIGDYKDNLIKPWQSYLDNRRQNNNHYFHDIDASLKSTKK